MKRFLISFLGILSVVIFFSLCYSVSFYNISKNLEGQKHQQDPVIQELVAETDEKEKLLPTQTPNQGNVEDVSTENAIITSSTICIYEVFDISTGEQLYYETQPGADMAGLTRKQLTDELKQYMKNLSVSEYEKGLISFELISFSPEKVVLQKVYDSSKVKYKYLVILKNEEVIVTYSDGKTVFEYTGITVDMLPEDILENLRKGIQIQTIEELYDYLSGITS